MGESEVVKSASGGWMPLFSRYEIGVYRGRRIIRGVLDPALHQGHPALEAVLDDWSGSSYLAETDEGLELLLIDPDRSRERPRWALHLLLLLLTLFTTFMAGSLLAGVDPLRAEAVRVWGAWFPVPTTVVWADMLRGAPFGLTLVGILLAHELGHYVAARIHGVRVTPPFFIPFPAYYSIVGTLGAFIRIKSPLIRRSVLFDVGAAGPWISFLVSLPALGAGLALSRPAPGPADLLTPFAIQFGGEPIWIGTSVAAGALAGLVLPGVAGVRTLVLHPVAVAGWVGLFVTALNLLPFGQLDGGHVLYALGGKRMQRWCGWGFLLVLVPLGLLWWGWWLWGGIAVFLSRGRIGHPPVLQESVRLDPVRTALGVGAILIFFLTFTPLPLSL